MFSLGCIYYYVLSGGEHPFGTHFHRTSNILNNKYNLKTLKCNAWRTELVEPLIECLISHTATDRPACAFVLAHPMFWADNKIMEFLKVGNFNSINSNACKLV